MRARPEKEGRRKRKEVRHKSRHETKPAAAAGQRISDQYAPWTKKEKVTKNADGGDNQLATGKAVETTKRKKQQKEVWE